ncbi:MAG: glycoside hydrolase family 28 protein [Ignavibacteria bacterium]
MRKYYQIIISFLSLLLFPTFICTGVDQKDSGWKQLHSIIKNINPPSFPEKEFNITSYGAAGDGKTDCTNAFKSAIEDCAKNGGGKVIVTKGIFLTGAVYLKSNVNLHLLEGAVIKFSADPEKYLPAVFTRWEGVECMNYSPLIYAYEQENIAVTGKGILDGQGSSENWWSWKGKSDSGWKKGMPRQNEDRDTLFKMAENNVPPEKRIFGGGHYLRPNFIQPYKCKNVLIEGVTFKDSPMWFIHPVLSQNVSILNITVEGLGPNNDGCNPESSKDVLIKNCRFNTGDDCIAIKSGRNNDGRRLNVPSENIIIQNCMMKEGHGGVVIGSEISGGVKNVFAEECEMDSPNLERALRKKTNSIRGGTIENIFMRNIKVGEVSEAVIKVDFFYEEGDKGEFTPVVKGIFVENLTSGKSEYAIWMKAYERSPVSDIELKNCTFKNAEKENVLVNVRNLKVDSVFVNDEQLIFSND